MQTLEKKLADNQAAILTTFQEQAAAESDERTLGQRLEQAKCKK